MATPIHDALASIHFVCAFKLWFICAFYKYFVGDDAHIVPIWCVRIYAGRRGRRPLQIDILTIKRAAYFVRINVEQVGIGIVLIRFLFR